MDIVLGLAQMCFDFSVQIAAIFGMIALCCYTIAGVLIDEDQQKLISLNKRYKRVASIFIKLGMFASVGIMIYAPAGLLLHEAYSIGFHIFIQILCLSLPFCLLGEYKKAYTRRFRLVRWNITTQSPL